MESRPTGKAAIKPLLITIDGPAGAGKTTVSRLLAGCLGYRLVDTGAIYRAVALFVVENNIDAANEKALAAFLDTLDVETEFDETGMALYINRRKIGDEIRTPEITKASSDISRLALVRKKLLAIQKDIGRRKQVVFEGRDMGTVVFPDADVKFFLTADSRIRAQRRYAQMKGKTGASLESVEEQMKIRDRNDSQREIAPLRPARDAHLIDATHADAHEVVNRMLAVIADIQAARY